ncbi:unnamed protein product [Rhizoctonia solani]|uniref:Pyroglutamyl-peptidase n=1 Tax=Rhizoctonia solani TaxID=456999 RepID=A0A8H7HI53_9AGAM|nr:pyroglutamyl-peptidase [Rhizoctonia solani]CAE6380576.1 unnamed protein product [Rhizoctonia solani]
MASIDSTSKPENKSLRVLVTGFGPFRNIETNPSWLAAKPLSNQTLKFTQSASPGHPHAPKPRPVEVEVHISTLEVPVTYSAVLGTVPPIHQSKQYDFILHVGVGLSGGVAIERLAHKTGYNQPDAEGRLCDLIRSKPKGDDADELVKRGFGNGFEQFGEELRSRLDVDAIVKHLKSKGLEHTSPSNDPGRYLCDFIYFCSLACAQKEASKVKVLFMHVPPVGSPYQIEDMTGAIKGVIEYVALHT